MSAEEQIYQVSVALPAGVNSAVRRRAGIEISRETGYTGPLTKEQLKAIKADAALSVLKAELEQPAPDPDEAAKLIANAQADAVKIVDEAKAEAKKVPEEAQADADKIKSDAQQVADDTKKAAKEVGEQIVAEAKKKAEAK